MAITTIVMDVYKPGSELKNKVVDISDSFNARVGDNQVRLVIKYVERGIVERMEQEQLTPFMMGWVGQPDEEQKVTAETGIAVSYHGSTDDIIAAGKVKMDLPGAMFPQEGMFYGFFGLENDKGKRVTTNTVRFQVENDNPDMYVDTEPFRSELQKLLDEAVAKSESTIGEIKTSWETLKQTILTMLATGNSNLDAYLNRLKLAEEQLAQYEKDLANNKGINQADLDTAMSGINKTIDDIKKQFDLKFTFNPNYDIGKNTIGSGVEAFVKQINPANLNLAVITDAHYEVIDRANFTDWCDYPYATTGIDHLANFLEIAKHTDMGVVNGDNTGGNMLSKETIMADEQLYTSRIIYSGSEVPIALMAGNHDDGSPARYKYPDEVMTEEELKQTFKTTENRFDEIRNQDSLYYYKDFKDKKVRLIHLWAEDVPEDVLDNNGYKKYPRWLWHGYRQAQLNWLINSALQVPADYQTIIMAHTPVVGSGYANNDVNAHFINHDLLEGIINAFVEGSSFAKENKAEDVGDGWGAVVNVDFSIQGERTLIGFFNGHTHREEIDQMYQFTQVHLMNDVCIKKSDFGTDKESAITVISVDTANKKVELLGYGRATNRSFNY